MAYSILVSWTVLDLEWRQKQLVRVRREGVPLFSWLAQHNPTSIQQAPALVSHSNSHTPPPTLLSSSHPLYQLQPSWNLPPLSRGSAPLSSCSLTLAPLTPCFSGPGSGYTEQGSQTQAEEALPGFLLSLGGRVHFTLAGGESHHFMFLET